MQFKNVDKVSKTIRLSNQLDQLLAGRKFEELDSKEQKLYNMLQAEIDYLHAKINGDAKARREKKRKLKAAQKQYKIGQFLNKFTAEQLNELATQSLIRSSSRTLIYTALGMISCVAAFVCAMCTLAGLPDIFTLIASLPIALAGVVNSVDFYLTEHTYKKLKSFAKLKEQEKVDLSNLESDIHLLTENNKVEVVKTIYSELNSNKQHEVGDLIKRMIKENYTQKQQKFAEFEAEQTQIKIPADENQDTQLEIDDMQNNIK